MSFQHPEFLYLLFAILIPVIIHLFNFRRYKKLMFSNIEFLKNITTQTRKQNQLKHLVVLLLRIFAIIFIVLAFAKPQWGEGSKEPPGSSVLKAIYIDNSFSMMAEGENGRFFDQALEQARNIVEQSPRDARFLLINNEPTSGKRVLSKEAGLPELDNFKRSFSKKDLSAVIRSAQKIANEKDFPALEMYLISDFQKYATGFEDFPKDTVGNYIFLPLEQTRMRNIYVDSCWFIDPVILPGKRIRMKIRIRNSSSSDLEKIPLKVYIDEQQKAAAGIDIKAGSQEIFNVNFTVNQAGWHYGLVEIEDYPITFDDNLYFSYQVSRHINILEIHNGVSGDQLSAFYGSDSVFHLKRVNYHKVDYNRFSNYNLIILNSIPQISSGLASQVSSYLSQGGSVFFIPDDRDDFEDENEAIRSLNAGRIASLDTNQSRVVRIKLQHELFREAITKIPENANLPVVHKHFRYRYNVASGVEGLVSLLNGDDFLLKKTTGQGQFYMLSVPLMEVYSNLASHPLFIPIMYGVALSGNATNKLFNTVGDDKLVDADIPSASMQESPFSIARLNGDYSFIPEQQFINGKLEMNMHDGIVSDGFYNLMLNDSVWQVYAFNYNRDESKMEFLSASELDEELSNTSLKNYRLINTSISGFSEVINALQKESELWKLFIIFALLMLLAEVLVLRFWK